MRFLGNAAKRWTCYRFFLKISGASWVFVLALVSSVSWALSGAQMAIRPPRALHVDGSNCFNRVTAIGLASTLTADNTSLTFRALIANQLNGTFSSSAHKGTFNLAVETSLRVQLQHCG